MKDRVFIAWSGTNEVANLVKNILEKKYNYVCSIGGNADNSSQMSSVGDTVLQQIKTCNQAIVIFQNRADGAVSNNLFFELGYVLASYGQKKVHCVRKFTEKVVLPTDFDNSFVEPLKKQNNESEELTTEEFAEQIVKYFISRQKMSINENKMFLINNRYLIHDKIISHYSEAGSKCSDYELAQYLLFYLQAAHMFGDEIKVYNEILEFKNAHHYEFSSELSLSVNICISFLEMVMNIKVKPNSDVYIDEDVFWKFRNDYMHYGTLVTTDDIGVFDEWVSVFLAEHFAFAYMLIANNDAFDDNMKRKFNEKAKQHAYETIDAIKDLEERTPSKENNDSIGLISLFKSYVYRNLYIAKQNLNEDGAQEWLEKTLQERKSLRKNFGKGTIDTQLYNNFCMEYYLALVNYLEFVDTSEIDEFELMMYRKEMKDYLNSVRKESNENPYLKQISNWCNQAV